MKELQMVNAFMKIMGQFKGTTPAIPFDAIRKLRFDLIDEENKELGLADNIVDVADGLCDLLYVTLGAFTAYGFTEELIQELFEEVQRSNMSKVCHTLQEAIDTKKKYGQQRVDTQIAKVFVEGTTYYTVVRNDGKVLKSIKWSEPDLRSILERHGVKC